MFRLSKKWSSGAILTNTSWHHLVQPIYFHASKWESTIRENSLSYFSVCVCVCQLLANAGVFCEWFDYLKAYGVVWGHIVRQHGVPSNTMPKQMQMPYHRLVLVSKLQCISSQYLPRRLISVSRFQRKDRNEWLHTNKCALLIHRRFCNFLL